MLIFEFIMI